MLFQKDRKHFVNIKKSIGLKGVHQTYSCGRAEKPLNVVKKSRKVTHFFFLRKRKEYILVPGVQLKEKLKY